MAQNPTRLYVGTPATGAVTLYTAPAGKTVIVKQIMLANWNNSVGVAIGLTLNGFYIVAPATIAPNGTTVVDLSLVMAAGDVLAKPAHAAANIDVTISGVVSP